MYECMYISKVEVIYLTPFKKRHMYMYIYTARYSISYLVRYMHHIFNINALYMTENSSRKVVHFYSGGIFL